MLITLPWPPMSLMPNRKTNRWLKARDTKEAREQAYFIALSQVTVSQLRKLGSVRLWYTFYPPDRIQRDYDSLLRACKPLTDSLVDANILAGDSPKVIKQVTLRMGEVSRDNARVEISIEEVI